MTSISILYMLGEIQVEYLAAGLAVLVFDLINNLVQMVSKD